MRSPLYHIPPSELIADSPRNYNCSLAEWRGTYWLAFRAHHMEDELRRCGVALVPLAPCPGEPGQPWRAAAPARWVDLPRPTGREHHEDPRLFVHGDRLHLAYVESRFYERSPYTCVIRYAALQIRATKRSFTVKAGPSHQPRYGRNDGSAHEKNWVFFTGADGTLKVIYAGEPHTILTLDGDRVIHESVAPSGEVVWPWGQIRGGTAPLPLPDGRLFTIFHSSLPTGQGPHWRRYHAGAYTFEPEPPYRITAISHAPLLSGDEDDGHGLDPRKEHGDPLAGEQWKPFVVFPGGAVPHEWGWHVAYGINDHFSVIADHSLADLRLGDPLFKTWAPRFFWTENASLPLRFITPAFEPEWIRWQPARSRIPTMVPAGILRVGNPAHLELVTAVPGVREIDEAEFRRLGGR